MAEINDLSVTDASNTARFPENQTPSSVNDGARALEGLLARGLKDTVDGCVTTGGSSTAYTVAANRTLTAYYDGLTQCVKWHTASGATPTVNIDSIGAKSLYWPDGTQVTSNHLAANSRAWIQYDGTNFLVMGAPVPTPIALGGTGATTAAGARTNLAAAGTGDNNTFTGSNTFNGTVTQDGAELLTGDISPTQLSANTDNYNPTGLATARRLRLSTDASRNLTGIEGGADGRRLALENVGSNDLVLVHDATSTAANRFLCPNSANFTIKANESAEIEYDGTSSRWRVLAKNSSSAAPTISVFTGSGTWTKPAGLSAALIELVAGGGGSSGLGGSVNYVVGSGGGGGEYARKRIAAASLGATETVTIGSGGTAGASGYSAGGSGGTTSFGAHCSVSGGAGGTSNSPNGEYDAGAGGSGGTGGDIHIPGGAGEAGASGSSTSSEAGGNGGASFFGGSVRRPAASGDGVAGSNYGGGAAGGVDVATSTNRAGAAGAAGVIVVTEFY